MNYETLIALRYLRSGGLQTALIIGGVIIGVSLFIVITALLNGSKSDVIKNVTGSVAHVVVKDMEREPKTLEQINVPQEMKNGFFVTFIEKTSQRKPKISSWQVLSQEISEIDKNIIIVSPSVSEQCFLSRNGKTVSISLEGIIPELKDKVVNISGHIKEGDFLSITNEQIAIGKRLADEMGIKLRDRVYILSSEGIGKFYMVACIFDIGVGSVDNGLAFTLLDSAQKLCKLNNSVTNFDVKLKDIYSAERVARKIHSQTGYKAESWMALNSGLMQALKAQDSTGIVLKYFTMLIVAFGIASVLVISVMEKSRDIGILKAMGATGMSIVKIFLMEGLIVGLTGAIIGTCLGLIICLIMGHFSTVVEFEGQRFNTFPMLYKISDIITVIAVSLIIGLLGAILPAWRASRLDPVKVIRYG
jgi:lipoprotein-releasing system permease protein